jgi:uncharacterized membrane protein
MATPFEGFVLPSTPLLVGLLVATVIVVAFVYLLEPPITERFVLAIVPWIFTGAALHVFYQLGEAYVVQIYPPAIESLFAAPAVYLTTFVAMGTIWIISLVIGTGMGSRDRSAQYLGGTGFGVAVVMLGLVIWQSLDPAVGPLNVVVPLIGIVASLVVTFVVYVALGAWRTYVIAEARLAGAIVLFAHTFDGITTALGVDVLGVGERSAIPRAIIEFAADLPTAQYIGSGWLFAAVKISVAVAIVWAFAEYVQERPVRGYLLFAVVTVVGLGPAFNNVLLFFLGI